MSENLTSQEPITRAQIEAAIQAVRDKGWDVNPYTVAEEARAQQAEISRSHEFMQLIVEARGGDVRFQTADSNDSNDSNNHRVVELEAEIQALHKQLEMARQPKVGTDDDVLNEQVKALLSSESDEQVKHLETELEQAYAQIVSLEEDKTDLTRSVTGLEKVNEALNVRLREVESEAAALKAQTGGDAGRPSSGDMEAINREMALKMEELVAGNRANNEHIALLEATNQQHESLILELEAKLAELQQEADMLALQLQNAFHVGYQKGLTDGKGSEEADGAVPAEALPAQQLADFAPTGEAAHVATGDQEVYTPGQYYEMHQQMPNVEIRQQAHAPEAGQDEQMEGHVAGWGSETDRVLNFARTGPYVASNYNPLESLSWRDLETVYSMGVLSIRDFSRNLAEYNAAGSDQAQPPEAPTPPSGDYADEENEPISELYPQEHPAPSNLFPETEAPVAEPPKAEGALDFIDELIDIDKLDIFDSLEELEELGTIDVMGDPIKINFDEGDSESTGETPLVEPEKQVSTEDLQELIKSRITQSKEQKTEYEVRTPPAPGQTDEEKKTGLGNKFIGGRGAGAAAPAAGGGPTSSSTTNPSVVTKHLPPEIRKHCMILGIRPEELTKDAVMKEWKKQITSVHPDLQGGDNESSIFLNTAKDALLKWLDANSPKLGGKFGSKGGSSSPFTGKNKGDDKS